jgi:hypothetical protein
MEIYLSEDIVIPNLSYNDNQDVLDLIIKKPKGLIPMLDEEGQVPRGSWEGFLSKFTKHHLGVSKRLKCKPGAKVFTLVHYAGDVVYDPSLFITKNKDTLSADLTEVMAVSVDPFVADLFRDVLEDQVVATGRASQVSSKQTVGTKFRIQLDSLVTTLNSTSPKYIRCIKPNSVKKPGVFEPDMTNEQLTYSGVFEAVIIMQNGYPFRLSHLEFRNRYHMLAKSSPPSRRLAIFGAACGRQELISLSEVLTELNGILQACHIGKTMVFYRVEQHRILESHRKAIIDHALHILQRSLRKFVVQNLFLLIQESTQDCTASVLRREGPNMRAHANHLIELNSRFLKTFQVSLRVPPCIEIAQRFSLALEVESKCLDALSELMDEGLNIFSIFPQLREVVRQFQSIEFSSSLDGQRLEVNWRTVDSFVAADARVQKYQKIIDIKQHLDKGVLDQNEVSLKYWLEKLDECRVVGEVDPEFCQAEEKAARSAVKDAEEIFEKFLRNAIDALTAGALTQVGARSDQKSFDDLISIHVEVDPRPLKAFVDSCNSTSSAPKTSKANGGKSSIQMEWLIRISKELLRLRELSAKKNWKAIWDLFPLWINYTTDPSHLETLDLTDQNALPAIPQVDDLLRGEIRTFYICAVGEVKFRKLGDELKKNHVPSSLTLCLPSTDLIPLMNIITFLNSPEEKANMNSDQLLALQFASTKGAIREKILQGDTSGLREILASSNALPLADPDHLLATRWLEFYDILDDLRKSLAVDGPQGTPGSLNLSSISSQTLHRIIQVGRGLVVDPADHWKQILAMIQLLNEVRASLVCNDLPSTLALIERAVSTEANPFAAAEQFAQDDSPDLFVEVLESTRREVELSKNEILHLLAVKDLLSVVHKGAVKGEVGALDTQSVEVNTLSSTLEKSRVHLIRTPPILQLVQDCEVLITLRSCVISGEWDYLLRVTEELVETTQGFLETHPELKPEFQVIYGEAKDLQARRQMEKALNEEVFFLSDQSDLLFQEETDLSYNLRNAICFSQSQKKLSFEAKFLLSNSILILALREAIVASAWEEEALSLHSIPTEEIGFALMDLVQLWSTDDKKSKLTSLLAPGKREKLTSLDLDRSPDQTQIIPVYKLLGHALAIEVHDLVARELAIVRRAFFERRCRAVLLLSASIGTIRGTVASLDNSLVAVEPLSRAITYAHMYSAQLSPLVRLWLEISTHLLHFRLALGEASSKNSVMIELSSYITRDQLARCSDIIKRSPRARVVESESVDVALKGFPTQELSLVIDYIYDCLSMNELADALHTGRPQFYNGKFDTKNVRYDHVIAALEVAKKCENISDHLDRLMFYANLCVNLRKAITNHKWDLSESGERAPPSLEQSRGFSVKQCLLEYQQANRFFQNLIEGIPPKTLKEEFLITQREWERRLILQGFPIAFQTGRVGGRNGNLLLHEIKYQRLADQIERTRSWSEQTGVKDPDLDLLVKAGQELVQVRRRALEVHQKYKREATFRRATNSISEILESEFISDAILNAIEKVDGLLVYPYPMNTEWKHIDQAVSKMEISGRIEPTRMQVELLGTETFERSFNGNIVRTLHSLDEFDSFPPHSDDVKIILHELQNSCHSYRARCLELGVKGSIKPSEVSDFLFISCVLVIHLLEAEATKRYDAFNRDWLTATKMGGSSCPSMSELSAHLMTPTWSVQDILRTAATISNIHPSARNQIFRVSHHVEEEVTLLELSSALEEGPVSGSVGHIQFERISTRSLSRALDRAIMFATTQADDDGKSIVAPKSRKWLTRSKAFLGNSSDIFLYSTKRNSARFRYKSDFNANQVAMIELCAGFQDAVVYDGIGRVQYRHVSPEVLSDALKKAETQSAYRADVVRLRHTCELICELREAIKLRNYKVAFDILNENLGEEGQSFKDLLASIYAANFSIHPKAVDEFSLIALETCESYWRFAAKSALIRGVVRGARCCFHLSEVNCDSIDEVLGMIEGLVEVSRESIVIRELCFLVKHLRKCTINAILSQDTEELLYKRRKDPIPYLASNKLNAVLKIGFVDDAIRNGILVVNALSPQPYSAIVQTNYAKFVTITNVVDHVKESIQVIDEKNLVVTHRDILLRECSLISDFCHFYTVMLTLERVMNIEAVWYSFSTSKLEIDANIKSLVQKAILDAEGLALNPSIPAENIWSPLLDLATAFRGVLDIITIDSSSGSCDCSVGSPYFAEQIFDKLERYLSCCRVSPFSPTLQRHSDVMRRCVLDHQSYLLLKELISNPRNFSVKLNSDEDPESFLAPLSPLEYSGEPIGNLKKSTAEMVPHSLATTKLKEIAILHLDMREAILAKQWSQALATAHTILVDDSLDIPWAEAKMVSQLVSLFRSCRQIKQGILSCIFPPVIGWSSYSAATSLALSITDFPLRAALESARDLKMKFGSAVGSGRNQLLDDLINLGAAILSLVYSVRRRTWSSRSPQENPEGASVDREFFVSLFPIDHSVIDNPSVALNLSFQDLFRVEECHLSVGSALNSVKGCLLKSSSLPDYLLAYVNFIVSSAEMEQQIFEFSKIISDVFCGEKVTGIPGQLQCSPQSIENISAVLRRLENDMATIDKSFGLRQSFQCLKLAKIYRSAVLKQDWHSLGPLIQLFQHMATLDRSENENQCAEFMHLSILDSDLLLEQPEEFLQQLYSDTLQSLRNFADHANTNLPTRQPTDDPLIQTAAKEILGIVDLQLILPSIPEMQEESTLLEKHFYFEKACQLFADALLHTPAVGLPGELQKQNIEYLRFYKVHELLRESGLLSYQSGTQLFEASSAMIALRVGQRSGRLEEIKQALLKCRAILSEEGKEPSSGGSNWDTNWSSKVVVRQRYLDDAVSEIELASLDYVQQECIHNLYSALISNRLPLSGDAISEAALLASSDSMPDFEQDITSDLSNAIRESQRKGVTCKRGQMLMTTGRLIVNIRKNVVTRDWIELKAIFSDFDIQEKDRYDRIALEEVESARRLMVISSAVEMARDAIDSNRIKGLIGEVDLMSVNVGALERAKEEFGLVKSEWLTQSILPYSISCNSLIPIRNFAVRYEWPTVYDLSSVALEKNSRIPQLVPNAALEIQLIRDHAGYMICRTSLIDAISNGRMDGDIGEISTSGISSAVVEEALRLSQHLDIEHPEIQRLEATARIIYDLRCAQQIGKWMADPLTRNSSARGNEESAQLLPDPDCMILTESIVPLSRFDLKPTMGTNSKSQLLSSYLARRIRHNPGQLFDRFSILPSEYGNVGWLMKSNGLDTDIHHLFSEDGVHQFHTVEEILEGAAYVERAIGIAEEALPEIAFAQEELNYRHTVHMLLRATSSAGFKNIPGKLDASDVDLYPLERAILFAESSPEISERGTCRSLLRDARILYQVRKYRMAKDWVELNKSILLAVSLSNLGPLPLEVNVFGEEVQPDPMLPFVWNEVSLIRADMYFYICLSEFAQEMTHRPAKDLNRDSRKEETASLTSLLRTILRTKASAETHPSSEFDRLLEAQHAALELRTHMTFDSTSSPRAIISNVINCRERDKKSGVTSYISLLMPDISQLSNVLDTEQLVESLEKAILRDQSYLRCPIGHINPDEIDLDFIRISITSAMPFLNATGSKEHLSLLSLATAILAIRTEVVSKNWPRVKELLDAHEFILGNHPGLVSEEIARLSIEAENDEACENMKRSLETGRLTNVLALVKKISRHRSASMSSITPLPRSNSSELPSAYPGRSFHHSRSVEIEENFLSQLDLSIDNALAVKNRSDITSGLLRASVLIRALRSAISTGDWEEVQQIVSEESNYTRMPVFSVEEIRAAKAALHYRNCMSNLAKGLVIGAASGIPGKINISAVDFTTLQTAISQAEVLDIADPATSIVLEVSYRICALRQAVVASHWFRNPPTIDDFFDVQELEVSVGENLEDRAARLRAASQSDIQVYTNVPFSSDTAVHELAPPPEAGALESDMTAIDSVESLLLEFKRRLFILSDLKTILNLRSISDEDPGIDSFDFDSFREDRTEFDDGTREMISTHDWVEHQLEAIRSVLQEIKLLDDDLRERRRQELVVSALEKIPAPVRQFKTRPEERADGGDQEREDLKDVFHIRHLEKSIQAAQSIKGEVPKETSRILRTAELILKFRKIMNSLEIDSFKLLLDEANMLASRNMLSMHYGVYELNSYRSATLTVTLAKAELIKALKSGRIRGSLAKINSDEIEVDSLEFWVSSCTSLMETTKELSMGLFDALQEAKIMLELRTLVKKDDWVSVNETLSRNADLFYRFEFGTDEIRHIQFASKFRSVSASISELVSDDLPSGKEDQCAYVLLKIDSLERALQSAEAVMKYQSDLLNQHLEKNRGFFADSNRTMLSRLLTRSIEEEEFEHSDQEDDSVTKEDSANMTEFQRLCFGAKSVIQLWRAIRKKVWFEEQIAAGQVHSLPRPKDPFLYLFLESLRQHEVSQRMGAIHDELRILKIDPDSKIRNIRQSVRTSFASRSRTHTMVAPPFKSQQKTPTNTPKSRRSSLSVDGSPAPRSGYSPIPPASPLHISSTASRRRSLGSLSGISEGQSPSPTPQHSTLSTKQEPEQESVAVILASSDWANLPLFAAKQFIQARNILIDRVTKLRLAWGCQEGCAEEGYYGNISLVNVNVELLGVALSDVRRIEFYTLQMTSKFSFSREVLNQIRVAKIVLSLRKAVISDNVELLIQELRQLNFLNGSRNFDLNLSAFPAFEKELRLFERFAFECIAEKTVRVAVKFLCSIDAMRATLTSHPSMLDLKSLDKTVKPIGQVTQNYSHCVKVSCLLWQAVQSSVMCNQPRVKRCELDLISFIQQPESPLSDSVRDFSKAMRTLYSSATIRALSDERHSQQSTSGLYDVQVDYISSIQSARRRSILGNTRSRRKSVVASNGYPEAKQESENSVPFPEMEPLQETEQTRSMPTPEHPNSSTLKALLLQIRETAEPCDGVRPSDFGSTMLQIPIETVTSLERFLQSPEDVLDSLLGGLDDQCEIDPLWALVGQLILLSVNALSRAMIQYGAQQPPTSSPLSSLQESMALLHPCVPEFLSTIQLSESCRPINLPSLSTFFTKLCMHLQWIDRHFPKLDSHRRPKKTYEVRDLKKKFKDQSPPNALESVCQVIMLFREYLASHSRELKESLSISDVEWMLSPYEETSRRVISHCNSLIRILNSTTLMTSSQEREKIQQGLREAVSKRKRQFASS